MLQNKLKYKKKKISLINYCYVAEHTILYYAQYKVVESSRILSAIAL